jgi:DNA-binding NtrC family response regulator
MEKETPGTERVRMTVLAISGDAQFVERLRDALSAMDYPVVEYVAAPDPRAGMEIVHRSVVDLVILGNSLPHGSRRQTLLSIKSVDPDIRVVVAADQDSAREAVPLLKCGAEDYLVPPITADTLQRLCRRISDELTFRREEASLRREIEVSLPPGTIVYQSPEMARVLQTAAVCADSDATVLITGESGTGKELVARLVHSIGRRKSRPFVAVSISALPETLVESELFGHRKGSFTGAVEDRAGRFEEADGGTLFIDEFGDISPALQVKLLRVLQFGQVERVGENRSRNLDVRIVAATNQNLGRLIEEGKFRPDLFYRLNVIPINIPPLRERKTDIPLLAGHLIRKFNTRCHRSIQGLSREAMGLLMRHPFPGNVRELENLIERACVLCRGECLRCDDFPGIAPSPGEPFGADHRRGPYGSAIRGFEQSLLERALQDAGGNQSGAARTLGITERHLRSRLVHLKVENRWRDVPADASRPPGRAVRPHGRGGSPSP